MGVVLRQLILAGLLLVGSLQASRTLADVVEPSDPIAGRSHWAFRPLSGARQTLEIGSTWSRSPIDEFILARLQSAGLAPAPDAPSQALVRRLYVQLIGLPPTPEQMESFTADSRPDALVRLVDSLLNSPHFGERWGRHWLDLARYADSNGLDENFLFREAWRYRNWVITALNQDLPFDRFTLEQVAGDMLPFDSISQRDHQRIGAGFLVIGPKVLLGNDPKKQRLEVADELIDTIGRTFLGLTLGCARCHDHKFEPVPRADYYALAGILTSTELMEQRYMLGEQRVMERLVGLGPDGDTLDERYEKYWRDYPKTKERASHAKSALKFLQTLDSEGLLAHQGKHADTISELAKDSSVPLEQRVISQQTLVSELDEILAKPPKIPPRAMIPADAVTPSDESIRLAGQFDRPGDRVPRGFLKVLNQGANTQGSISEGKSGRLELGHWITDVEHGAGNLTARVLANRIWHHLMGVGIVRTVDNFGRTGEAPSHPELLDYLANELVTSGWSIKSLVRQVVLSRTFALSSRHETKAQVIDPENRLLWRAHRRRLDPESLRDALLSVAGQLNLAPMESSVWYLGDQATAVGKNEVRRRTDFTCRTIYLPVIRNDLPELFQAFNFADPHATTGARPQTTSATQGLFVLNDRVVMDAAEALARRLFTELPGTDLELRIDRLFDLLIQARPTADEKKDFLAIIRNLEGQARQQGHPNPELRSWSIACHTAFLMSRFQFLE
jgi:hypothetical protein